MKKVSKAFLNHHDDNVRKVIKLLLKDSENMKIKERLAFAIKYGEDATKEAEKDMKDINFKEANCLIIAILSHGNTGVVKGVVFKYFTVNFLFEIVKRTSLKNLPE